MVRPFLVEKLNQSFPDPAHFTQATDPKEAFFYAAMTSSVFKKVIAELLGWVEQHQDNAEYLTKKEKGEVTDSFEVGG